LEGERLLLQNSQQVLAMPSANMRCAVGR